MLTLYHHGSSVCAAKVRIAMQEKQLEFKTVYVDILTGEQFTADYMKLNPKAVVPTLVHDAHVLVESTAICEYLDEAFPNPPLMPATPIGRHAVRLWTKAIDEDLHPACAVITFASSHRHTIRRAGPEGVEKFLNSTPGMSVTPEWKAQKRRVIELGFDAPEVATKFKLYVRYLDKMEQALRVQPWIGGDSYSLADIGMTPYVNRLAMMSMGGLWEGGTRPRLAEWFARVRERPTFQSAVLDWCPPALTDDLKTFGAQSWPDVQRVLAS
ncbi:MAG: glutathione S-transferase family protein [Steroidobacterales bacterium]